MTISYSIAMSNRYIFVAFLLATLLQGCSTNQPRSESPTHPAGAPTANNILFRAISLVGTAYRYGGNTPQGGFDCSGLIAYVFSDVGGIALPHSTAELSDLPAPEIPRDQMQSGDLVFFHGNSTHITHVGIYVGEQRFVHAPNSGGTVRLDRLSEGYWSTHFSRAKRIALPSQPAGTPPHPTLSTR